MAFEKQKKDLAFFLIEQATGMKPGDFLKSFKNLPANQKSKLISSENVSDALRLLANQSDNRADDILQIITEPQFRNQRVALVNHYATNPELKAYTDRIKNAFLEAQSKPKLADGRSAPVQLSKADIETFAQFYNTKNPYLMQQIKSVLGANNFGNIQKTAKNRFKLIDDTATKFYNDVGQRGFTLRELALADEAIIRAGNILTEYKKRVPDTTGSELRQGTYNFGYIDVIKLFETDPIIKAYLNAPSRQTITSKGVPITGKSQQTVRDRKDKILLALKRDGTLDKLGLGSVNLRGSPPKLNIIDDPKVKAIIEAEAKKGNKSLIRSNMVQYLEPEQKAYFDNFLNTFRQRMYDMNLDVAPKMREFGEADNHANRSLDLIRSNFNRYMRFALFEGKSIDQAFDGFKKQIEKKDFIDQAIPILYQTEKLRDSIKYNFKKYGIDFPQVSLSHQARVIDHIDKAFKTNNLFTGFRKLNKEENTLQQQIASLKRRIQQRGGSKLIQSDETVRNLQKELDDLEYKLDSGGYYDPVPVDFEDTMKQAITDISTAGYGLLADGGFASIEDMLGYGNE